MHEAELITVQPGVVSSSRALTAKRQLTKGRPGHLWGYCEIP
jgi:hypothetical protein